jgi:hypothetical protein
VGAISAGLSADCLSWWLQSVHRKATASVADYLTADRPQKVVHGPDFIKGEIWLIQNDKHFTAIFVVG